MTKRMTRYVSVALLTFTIGAGITMFWVARHRSPVQKSEPVLTCYGDSAKAINAEPQATVSYFPTGIYSPNSEIETAAAKGYSNILTKLREPSFLSLPDCVDEAYRFLWLRAFDPYITVRVWESQKEYFLIAKEISQDGKISAQNFRRLSNDEWSKFKSLLETASYWDIPTFQNTFGGTDGAYWIMEGTKQKQYHLVDRWTLYNDEKYRAACIYLARLSGLDIKESHFSEY